MTQNRKHICFLGYNRKETKIIKYIESIGHKVHHFQNECPDLSPYHTVISFGFRKIIPKEFIETCQKPILNLHISLLPYNRGAHPNFWSFMDETPAGVTIHEIDSGIDTGPICFQKEVFFPNQTEITFTQSQSYLSEEIEQLFIANADLLISGNYQARAQEGHSTYHKARELPEWADWDMSIETARRRFYPEK